MSATTEFALLGSAPEPGGQAVTSAAVEILDAGDALIAALGAYLDGDIGPRVEQQGMDALERWRCASDAFLSIVDRELGEH